MAQATSDTQWLYSSLAADPDLREIVKLFVEEMPDRAAALIEHLNSANWEGLRRSAHQLKGAAGSYGFHAISPYAGRVEESIFQGEPEERIRAATEELIDLCRRVRAGTPV